MIGDLADLLELANANPAVMILGLYFAAHVGYYTMNRRIRDIDEDVESVSSKVGTVGENLQDTRERVIRVEEHTDHLAEEQTRQDEQIRDLKTDEPDPGTAQTDVNRKRPRSRVKADGSGD